MRLPEGLEWWHGRPGGSEWLAALPALVEACAEQWMLRLRAPFEPAHIALVVPVELADGEPAVLKVNFPDEESEHEADALAHWAGDGAVRLLAHDETRRALLIERCEPGSQLWAIEDEDEATRVAASVLERLWRSAPAQHRFRTLAGQAARWAEEVPAMWSELGKPFDRRTLDEAVAACVELGPTQGKQVVLHQDFHGGNVLRAEREPWLAIDPKPLVGEREFDAASLLRDQRWLLGGPHDAARIRRRLDLLADELGLDRERMRRWGVAHALAWGFSGQKLEHDMIRCAHLLADAA